MIIIMIIIRIIIRMLYVPLVCVLYEFACF